MPFTFQPPLQSLLALLLNFLVASKIFLLSSFACSCSLVGISAINWRSAFSLFLSVKPGAAGSAELTCASSMILEARRDSKLNSGSLPFLDRLVGPVSPLALRFFPDFFFVYFAKNNVKSKLHASSFLFSRYLILPLLSRCFLRFFCGLCCELRLILFW